MGKLLSREAILAAPVPTTEIEVPDWGGSVRIRALSAKSRVLVLDAIEDNLDKHRAWKEDQAKPVVEREGLERVDIYEQHIVALIFCMVDENGEQLFSLDDYEAIRVLDHQTILNLWIAMKKHENRDPEALKKSSASTRSGGSSSGSRSRSAKR